jgi:hypothetical protein
LQAEGPAWEQIFTDKKEKKEKNYIFFVTVLIYNKQFYPLALALFYSQINDI